MTFAIRDLEGIAVTEEDAAYGALVVTCGEFDGKHNTVNLAKRCVEDGVPGDFVECGVNAGGHPALMGYVIRRYGDGVPAPRKIHLFDSFAGQPQAGPDDPLEYQKILGLNEDRRHGLPSGEFIAYRWQVEQNMRKWGVPLDRLVYHEGWLQDVLPPIAADFPAIALLRVDVDLVDSTTPVFEHLYDRVSSGGYVISDDWGEYPLEGEPRGCRRAAIEAMARRGHSLSEVTQLARSTGIGWWRKP